MRVLSLSALIAAALACQSASAITLPVDVCTDSTVPSDNTLRHVLTRAQSGDVVDIHQCSSLALVGPVSIPSSINNLTIRGGATADAVVIASARGVAFSDFSTGTVTFSGLTVTGASGTNQYYSCIESAGSVTLSSSKVIDCSIHQPQYFGAVSQAAGITAVGNVTLQSSEISENVVYARSNQAVHGVGIQAGSISLIDSKVSGNVAEGAKSVSGVGLFSKGLFAGDSVISGNVSIYIAASKGAGAYVTDGNAIIKYSTIANNSSDRNSALVVTSSSPATPTSLTLLNSTITGNRSGGSGTVGSYGATAVYNSTIANNDVRYSRANAPTGLSSGGTTTLSSSIISNNSAYIGSEYQFYAPSSGGTVGGSNNLIGFSSTPLPQDTLSSCPRLGTLAMNGGPTPTLALLPGSPAIDHGIANNLTADQRESPFGRSAGLAPDIGAFELQSNEKLDQIFVSRFDGACR